MKRIVLLLSMLLCVFALGFGLVSCSDDLDNLSLDSEGFDTVVEYRATVDFGSLYLVYGEGEDQVRIPVTADMIDGDYSTDTVGRKNILVRYEGRLLRFSFDVKYCATFMAGETVIEKVYLDEGEALTPPSPDAYAPVGMEFVGWTPTVPEALTDNATFTAQYAPSTEPPVLSELSASWGQTLADLTLPSSAVGAWVFVDAPETSVGELGAHTFAVRFMPSDPLALPIDEEVTVTVGKATLDFSDLVTSFIYDGTEKFPTYTVPEGVTVIALGDRETNVGSYDFTLLVDDPHYEGTYTGSYTVTKAAAVITLPDYELPFDEAKTFVPTTYTVEGLDASLLGKVTVMKPSFTGAGVYPLTVIIENAANVEIKKEGGTLTVTKSTLTLDPPTLSSGVVAHYGDTLSSLALSAHASGVWSWKDASLTINTAGEYSAIAVFTPTNTAGYEIAEQEITFAVAKKALPLTITVGAPVYNGSSHVATVRIADGEYDSLGLTVNILYNGVSNAPVKAGLYTVTAELADERYEGRATAQMNIAKATPTGVDFSLLFDELIWSENGHTLSEIALPVGYSWVNASTAIPDSNIGVFVAYPAIFTPADTENYAVVNGEFKLLLNRAPAGIVGSAQHEFTYNAASHTLDDGRFDGSHEESTLSFYDESGNRFDFATLKNVGTYKIVVVLPESTHYEKAERTVTVTVKSGEYPDKTPPTGLSGTYTYTLSDVMLPSDPDGVWTWQNPDEILDLVGKKTVTAIFTPNDTGYNSFTAGIELTVGPKPIPVPTATYEKPYNGQRQPAGALPGEGYTVIDNGGTTVGTYKVIYSLTGGNYVWEDGSTTNKEVACFTITKAPNAFITAPILNKYEWKYDEDPATLNAYATSFGVADLILDGQRVTEILAGLSAGEHTLTLTVAGTANYAGIETSLTFTVKKGEVEIPTLAGKVYNGQPQSASLPGSALLYEIKQNVSEVSVKADYKVTLTLKDADNYQWKDHEGADVTVDFAITKAPNNWNVVPTLSKTEWTYGAAAATLNAYVAKFGQVELMLDGKGITALPAVLDAGSHTLVVSVADTADFAGLTQTFSFKVNKAEVEIPTLSSKPYNGEAQGASFPTVPTLYSIKTNVSETNVGTYNVTLTLTDATNYVWKNSEGADVTVSFSITKGENVWTTAPSVPGIIFGGTLSPIGTPKFGTVTVEYKRYGTADPYTATKPTAQGAYYARFTVEETDNYKGLVAENVRFSIAAATNAWAEEPTVDKTEWTYGDAVATVLNGGKATFGDVAIILDDKVVTEIPAILDAGTHTLTFRVEGTADYTNLTKTFTLTVSPKKVIAPTEGFKATYNGESQTAGAVAGEGYTVEDLGGTNAKTYPVVYKLKANYIWSDGSTGDKSVDFVIAPKKISIPTATYEKTYNGQRQPAGALPGEGYAVIDNGGTIVGTYNVIYSLTGGNYVWEDGSTTNKEVACFTIKQAENAWTTAPVLNKYEWKYDEDPATLNPFAASFGVAKIFFNGNEITAIPAGLAVGDYTLTVLIEATANYKGLTETLRFTVDPATVDVSVVPTTPFGTTYNGEAQTAGAVAGEGYKVIDTEHTDADTYSVVYKLAANYVWSDGTTADKSVDFVIAPKPISIPIATYEKTYTGSLQKAGAAAGEGYTVEDLGGIDAGTYSVVYKLKANYIWLDGTTADKSVECFTIRKIVVELPDNASTVYTGSAQSSSFGVDGVYTAANVEKTDVDDYSVTLTLADPANYEWENSKTSETATVTFSITKADNAWTVAPSVPSIIFGETLLPVGEAKFGTVLVQYKEADAGDETYTTAVPTEKGSYVARFTVEDTANYAALTATVPFSISSATNTWVEEPTVDKTEWTYGDEVAVITNGKATFGTVTVTLNGQPFIAMPTDAGTYTLTFRVEGTNDYTTLTKTFTLTVSPKKVTAPTDSFKATYNGESQTAGAEAGEGYTVVDNGGTNVGKYSVTYKLSANYIWSDGLTDDKTVDFVILPKKVIAPTEGFKATYNGESQTAGAVAGEGYTVEDLGGTNAKTYPVVYKLKDNYVWSDGSTDDKTVDFVIAKAEVEIPTLDSKPYNGKAQGATLPADATLYSIKENVSKMSAGTYTVTLMLADPLNYVWKNREETDVSVDFVIEKAKAAVSDLTVDDWSFRGEASAPAFTLSPFYDGTVSYLYSGTTATGFPYEDDEAPLVAGSYTLTVSIAATANCDIAEGGDAAEYSFRILPKKIDKPMATVETIVYDGKNHKPDLSGLPTGCGAVSNKGRTDVGLYSVEFSLYDIYNYVWSDGTTDNFTIDYYEIVKADNAWTVEPMLGKNSWAYGSPASLSYAAKLGTVSLMLDGKLVEAIPVDLAVGDHTLIVSVEGTENYTGLTKELSFTVEPIVVDVNIIPTVPFGTTYNGEAQTAGAVAGEGYTVEDLGGTNAGTYAVTYKLVSGNYIWSDGTTADKSVDFVIAPITVTLPSESFTTVYNGEAQTAGAVAGEGYTVEDLGGVDAGTYAVVYKLVSGNYIWNDGTAADKSVPCFTITKAENAWTTEPSLSKNGWKYGEEVAVLTYAAKYGSVVLTLNGEVIEALPALLKADDYVLVVSVTDTDSYAGLTERFSFTVEKAEVEVPWFGSVPYTGEIWNAVLPENVTLYTITENVNKATAGTHLVTLTLKDPDSCVWKNENGLVEGADVKVNFIISKVDNAWTKEPTLSKNEWKYGEAVGTPSEVASKFGKVVITLNGEPKNTLPTEFDVGAYTLSFEVEGTNNYNRLVKTFTFTVTKGEVMIPTYTVPYNGNPQGASLPTLPEGSKGLYTIKQNVSETNVGNYSVTLSLTDPDNSSWVDEEGNFIEDVDISVPFIIEQAKNGWTKEPTLSKNSWKYGEATATLDYYAVRFGTPTLTLNGEVVTEIPASLPIGDYELAFTVEETPNYEGVSATLSFTVDPAIVDVSVVPTVPFEKTYNGAAQKAGASSGKGYTATDAEHTDAATYTVTYKLISGNYIWSDGTTADKSVDFIIKPAVPTVLFPEYTKPVYQNNISFRGQATGLGDAPLDGRFTSDKTLSPTSPFFTPGAETEKSFTYMVTFTPDNKNYATVSKEITVTLKAAAYIGSTYYGSIEDALYHAVSGNEVWVVLDASDSILSGNIIKSNCTIKEGVTLVLPYEKDGAAAINAKDQAALNGTALYNGDMLYVDTNADSAYTAGTDPYLHITNTVTVAAGVRITNLGTLKIGGELSGAAGGSIYAGHTAGSAAQLILSRGAVIESSGTVKAYGFIEEAVKDNGSKVVITAGRIDIPFVLRDFRGGTLMGAAAKADGGENYVSVFNRFIFNNVMPMLEVTYNGNVYGIANLYAGGQHNSTTAHMVGNTATAVVQFTNQASKLVAKYDKDTEVCKLDLYGGAQTNGMVLTLKVLTKSVTIDTANYAFALSYHFDISLKAVEGAANQFTMGQLFKLMPGARIVVEEGTTLNVTNMNIYGADFKDPCLTRPYPHNGTDPVNSATSTACINERTKEVLGGGMLLVYGHLNATDIGGTVHLGAGGTTNDLSGKSCMTKDLFTGEQDKIGGALGGIFGGDDATMGFTATFNILMQNAALAGYGTVVTIDAAGGITDIPFIVAKDGKITLPSAERGGYTFNGWYTAAEGGSKVGDAGDVFETSESLTLYAQWSKMETTIVTFDQNGGTCNKPSLPVDENGNVILPDASKPGHAFNGWYTAPTGGEKIGDAGATYTPTADITLFAQYTAYTVTFEANGGSVSPGSAQATDGSITLPTPTRSSYKFKGWYTASSGGTKIGDAKASYTPSGNITLYAQWDYDGGCVTGDTLVTLADGSQKELWQLQVDDDILAYDFYTGKFTVVKAGYIMNHGYAENTVITLYFDDGTVIRVVNVHGFFDIATREFIFVRADNVDELIGREFVKQGEDGCVATVKLIDYSVSVEYIEAWSPLSAGAYNCLLNGMVSVPPPEYGGNIFMPFEVGEDMKIDEEKMQADIEAYGLYTYEEWSDRMPRELFDALSMQYIKVAVGKGIITEAELDMLLALHFGI